MLSRFFYFYNDKYFPKKSDFFQEFKVAGDKWTDNFVR